MSRFEELIVEMRAEIEAAYKRGFEAGASDMRDRILNAAQGPVEAPAPGPRKAFVTPSHWKPLTIVQTRAPRGAVGAMLRRILTEKPGLTVTEIEAIAPEYDPEVAAKSIGNELRRFDGMKYKRDQRSRWFLFDGPFVETETPAESPAGDVFS